MDEMQKSVEAPLEQARKEYGPKGKYRWYAPAYLLGYAEATLWAIEQYNKDGRPDKVQEQIDGYRALKEAIKL